VHILKIDSGYMICFDYWTYQRKFTNIDSELNR